MTAEDLDAIVATARAADDRGRVADYIPGLAGVDPQAFGIAIRLADGTEWAAGDADIAFSIQSISKVFSLTMALVEHGEQLWMRVGVEPSGSAFNSIVQLEAERGVPRNPFINAGAIAVADALIADVPWRDRTIDLLNFVRDRSGDPAVEIDTLVAASEEATGYRNTALANYMRAFDVVARPAEAIKFYFHQCALAMSCRQLARAGGYLMAGGVDPGSGQRVIDERGAQRILSLMLTCGHYDGSGEFAFRVGIPGKSGVGGGILAIVPGVASIAVWSPGLNARGNSKLGSEALETLARVSGWSVFAPPLCG